jgi:hypothetical protein
MLSQTRQALEAFDNQHDFERLAADVLNHLGYDTVEPMAPGGGADLQRCCRCRWRFPELRHHVGGGRGRVRRTLAGRAVVVACVRLVRLSQAAGGCLGCACSQRMIRAAHVSEEVGPTARLGSAAASAGRFARGAFPPRPPLPNKRAEPSKFAYLSGNPLRISRDRAFQQGSRCSGWITSDLYRKRPGGKHSGDARWLWPGRFGPSRKKEAAARRVGWLVSASKRISRYRADDSQWPELINSMNKGGCLRRPRGV